MREIGIVVFFCKYNKQTNSFGNYGFISPCIPLQGANRDIYVRDKDADPKIISNDIVTFERIESPKGYVAKYVKKLKDDQEVLRQFISTNNYKENNKIIKFIKDYNDIAYSRFQKEILSKLPGDDIERSLWIWPYLDVSQLRQIINNRYLGDGKDYVDIYEKDKKHFDTQGDETWFYNNYIRNIPIEVIKNTPVLLNDALWIWPSLNSSQLKELVNYRYKETDKDYKELYMVERKFFIYSSDLFWFKNTYLKLVPKDVVKVTPIIMEDLPYHEQTEIVRIHMSEGIYDYWDWDRIFIIKQPTLFELTPDNIKYVDEELYAKFSNETKAHYWCLTYKKKEDKTQARQQILNFLKESHAFYINENEIPDEIIPTEEALRVTSVSRKREALFNSKDKFNDMEKEAILNSILDDCRYDSQINGINVYLTSYYELQVKEISELLESGILDIKILAVCWDKIVNKFPEAAINIINKIEEPLSKEYLINDNLKILSLYLMAKNNAHNEDILRITKPEDNSNKVAAVRLFYESGQSLKQGWRDEAEDFFVKAHGALLSLMQLQDGKIADTEYLFPKCTKTNAKCRYCEAKIRILSTDNENKKECAYCPRTRVKFDLDDDCARIKARTKLPVGSWSLLEFFEVLGLTGFKISSSQHLSRTRDVDLSQIDLRAHLSDLRDFREYVPRMAGGFNRLYAIGDHIKCRKCMENMIFKLKYSINDFAVYMSTTASCGDGDPDHDHNVYLSHCHGCYKIIDSRYDKFKDGENFYICTRCGTGGYHTRPGTICPECGKAGSNMIPLGYNNEYRCNHCGHEIRVPSR